jgi:hypothetical protein
MSEREQIIAAIKAEDIKQEGWELTILQRIKDRYVLGVVRTKMSQISDVYAYDEEEFREELIAVCERVYWQDPKPTFNVHGWASDLNSLLKQRANLYREQGQIWQARGVDEAQKIVEKETQGLVGNFEPPTA